MKEISKILLKSGTNELEIVEFNIGKNYFGINVAKIKEVVRKTDITEIPNTHPCVSGVIKHRNKIITVVNLPKYLNLSIDHLEENSFFIITYFNQITIAFQVSSVIGINRLSWKDVEKPDANLCGELESNISGIIKNSENVIAILDFEKIIFDISPRTGIQVLDIKTIEPRERRNKPILIAEDSQMLAKILEECLKEAGYDDLTITSNGKEAWDILQEVENRQDKKPYEIFSCVITDIEMPQMDGHHLIKCIKEDAILKDLPVVIFSSLISEQIMEKGKKLGANAQISKPEIKKLVEVIDSMILSKVETNTKSGGEII
ncbi:putative CheW protein [Alkaliphilus metalliredigens QYMF]|uniref:Stage 0 sporulation protein A homolog n=1 Tax=Alkaliphilus metalliredigens (strain QYMF) TaxID=293826 RepID=A6TRR5_ALKMQ|nr:chemotaxis protein [Alkaliphilus metalliredigens]ABR48883.1 putative CheW protein [Alkaliphilus metalliredigens QYMF]